MWKEKYFTIWCNPLGFLRHINEKKNSLYFCTCKIDLYESPPTYTFDYISRFSATAGSAACTRTGAVQNRSGHTVLDGRRQDATRKPPILL
jgi:hypothetical protein